MNRTNKNNVSLVKGELITVDTDGLQLLLSCGRQTAVRIGEDCGARIQIGRRVFWNVEIVKEYMREMAA